MTTSAFESLIARFEALDRCLAALERRLAVMVGLQLLSLGAVLARYVL